MRSIEQERAANALARANELSKECGDFKKRYRAYVDRLGPTIVMNGLGQALATERAGAGTERKKDDERAHHELYESLQRWLCRPEGGVYPSSADLLQSIVDNDERAVSACPGRGAGMARVAQKVLPGKFPEGWGRRRVTRPLHRDAAETPEGPVVRRPCGFVV